jgi:putative hydrolase of the HAD superfamily
MKQKKIEAVIFDLGRVIVNIDLRGGIFKYFTQNVAGSDEDAMRTMIKDDVFRQAMQGKITPQQLHEKLSDRFGLNLNYKEFVNTWCGMFSPNPGMAQLIAELSGQVKLGLLSDADALHWGFIKNNYPEMKYFKKPTISFEVGITKPAKEIYVKAAENTGAAIENCIFFDDLAANVKGAIDAGMQAVVFENPQQVRRELAERGFPKI